MESELLFGHISNIIWDTSRKISAILSNAKDISVEDTMNGLSRFDEIVREKAPSVDRRSLKEQFNGPIIIPYNPNLISSNESSQQVKLDPSVSSKENKVKRKRGRPRKHFFDENGNKLKRKGGRPQKNPMIAVNQPSIRENNENENNQNNQNKVKRKRGRPRKVAFVDESMNLFNRRSSRIKDSEKIPTYTYKRKWNARKDLSFQKSFERLSSSHEELSYEEPLEKRMFKEVQGVDQKDKTYYGVNQLGEEFSCALNDISNHINFNTISITRISARVRFHDRIGVFVKFDTIPEEVLMNISPSIDEARRKLN